MSTPSIRVSESFTSIQGEGPNSGEPAHFLRLANCNLTCSWCDSRYTWDWSTHDRRKEVQTWSSDDVIERLLREIPERVRLLVLTGGEPLLQQRTVTAPLRAVLAQRPRLRLEVETNGTIAPTLEFASLVTLFVVSPKLRNSRVDISKRFRPPALSALAGLPAILKFVIESVDDIDEAVRVATDAGFSRDRVWIMPEGIESEVLRRRLRELSAAAIEQGVRLTDRIHVHLWGNARGI